MKHYIFFILTCVICMSNVFGQVPLGAGEIIIDPPPFPLPVPEVDTFQRIDLSNDYVFGFPEATGNEKSSVFGRNFTPRGEFKILLIFVTFDNPNEPDPTNPKWPSTSPVPTWYTNDEFVFNDINEFDNIGQDDRSISNYLYTMSKQLPPEDQLKVHAGHLSVHIDIDPATDNSFVGLSRKALAQLEITYPNIEEILQQYDNRGDYSLYEYDNRTTGGDGVVDYAIMYFRYGGWEPEEHPFLAMADWDFTGGAWADIENHDYGSIEIKSGFTQPPGMKPDHHTFLHEMAHTVFDAPHYGGANSVFGPYLRSNSFWGMISSGTNEIFPGSNAWERWYLGYTEITHDLNNVAHNGEYILRDHLTTGDAIRIKLPYVTDQYIWLENRSGITEFDRRYSIPLNMCDVSKPTPAAPKGLMAYVERLASDRNEVSIFTSGANGARLLDANGNRDYSIGSWDTEQLCGEKTIPNFITGQPNPYEGYSLSSRALFDSSGNNVIEYLDHTWNSSNGGPKENSGLWKIDGQFIFGNYGPNSAFGVGGKIGIGTNPPIMNMRPYDNTNKKMSDIFLNGISVEVLSWEQDKDIDPFCSMTVKVKFDDFDFNEDIRMCGYITLPPATVNLRPRTTITVDNSGVYNRTTLRNGVFINPTIVKTTTSTNFHILEDATLEVNGGSVLKIVGESDVNLWVRSKIIVHEGGTLIIEDGAGLNLNANSSIEVLDGGYLCNNNGDINLQDGLSVINLYPGSLNGVNPTSTDGNETCQTTSHSFAGLGSINNFTSDLYVQNETFSSDAYKAGINIYVGNNVTTSKPVGDVVINSGAKVVFNATNDVVLEAGFVVQPGGEIEIW